MIERISFRAYEMSLKSYKEFSEASAECSAKGYRTRQVAGKASILYR
jgi:hypothetical protein